MAGDFRLELNKDWIDYSAAWVSVYSLFKPEMVFVRRRNIRKTDSSLRLTKWVNNSYIKSVSWENGIGYTTDRKNELRTRENSSVISMTASSGDGVSYSINRDYEFLPGADFIRDILIEQGTYDVTFHRFNVSSYRGRPVSGTISYRWGERFDGEDKTLSLSNRILRLVRIMSRTGCL